MPRSPVTMVAPVFVTAGVPARTANAAAVPRPTGDGPAALAVGAPPSRLIAKVSATLAANANVSLRNGVVIVDVSHTLAKLTAEAPSRRAVILARVERSRRSGCDRRYAARPAARDASVILTPARTVG